MIPILGNTLPKPLRTAFVRWLRKFKPQEDRGKAMILSLGKVDDVQSQQSASVRETVDSHDKGDLGEI